MFRLDLYATDQFSVLPVIKCQAIHRSYTKQETSINACIQKMRTHKLKEKQLMSIAKKIIIQRRSSTLSSKIRLERFLFLEIFK